MMLGDGVFAFHRAQEVKVEAGGGRSRESCAAPPGPPPGAAWNVLAPMDSSASTNCSIFEDDHELACLLADGGQLQVVLPDQAAGVVWASAGVSAASLQLAVPSPTAPPPPAAPAEASPAVPVLLASPSPAHSNSRASSQGASYCDGRPAKRARAQAMPPQLAAAAMPASTAAGAAPGQQRGAKALQQQQQRISWQRHMRETQELRQQATTLESSNASLREQVASLTGQQRELIERVSTLTRKFAACVSENQVLLQDNTRMRQESCLWQQQVAALQRALQDAQQWLGRAPAAHAPQQP